MSQPLLDQLHLHALRDQERGAGVTQIVEADMLEAVLLQDRGKAVTHVIGREQLAQRVPPNQDYPNTTEKSLKNIVLTLL